MGSKDQGRSSDRGSDTRLTNSRQRGVVLWSKPSHGTWSRGSSRMNPRTSKNPRTCRQPSRPPRSAKLPDIVDAATRSRMMSGIKGRDTKPELVVRKALHGRGFRYRLHARDLPGRPDIVFPRYRVAAFVHGCFWHGHNCPLFRLPGTRRAFWKEKIEKNRQRDETAARRLEDADWRRLTIWECALRGKGRLPIADVIDTAEHWLKGQGTTLEIRGIV